MTTETDLKDIVEVMELNKVFEDFTEAEKYQLAAVAERKHYSKNQLVFSIDHKGKYFYLVESGDLLLRLKDSKTKVYQRGKLFGEIGLFTQSYRMGTIRALSDSSLLAFSGERVYDSEELPTKLALKLTKALTLKIIDYINARQQTSSRHLIASGESNVVEFKKNPSRSAMSKILKTLVAFMNTKGGTLFIGVDDDKTIVGIPLESYKEIDQFNLDLVNMINNHIGSFFTSLVGFDIEEIGGKTVFRIDCAVATRPAFYRDGGEELFYIRSGPSNTRLQPSGIINYIQRRLEGK
jgi:CRP-like cAMP-binding protein